MTSPLISAGDLAGHLGDPNFAVFDCRFDLANADAGLSAYLAGHVPGASYAHLDHNLSGAKTGSNGRHPLPDRAALVQFLRAHGVGLDTFVVAYDAKDSMYAARLWWLMRWLGHAHVAVLNGGFLAWQEAGLPTDKLLVTHATEGDFAAHESLVPIADISVVEERAQRGLLVVDARAAPRYRGEMEPLDRVPGHIPLAVNRPYAENLDANGMFLSPARLRQAFLAVIGDHAVSHVVNQCGSGVTACHNLLAMEVAGLTGSLLYPGSYSEWSSDPARPIATGTTP